MGTGDPGRPRKAVNHEEAQWKEEDLRCFKQGKNMDRYE